MDLFLYPVILLSAMLAGLAVWFIKSEIDHINNLRLIQRRRRIA